MIAYKGTVVAAEAPGFIKRGVHVEKGGHFAIVVPRSWVGTHDLVVECTGELPASVKGRALLVHDSGAYSYGQITLSSDDGKAKFLLTTSGLSDFGNWVSIELSNANNAEGATWRTDGCSVEHL